MLTLYHGWRSNSSRRVRLCLAEKGVTFESRIIDLTEMEHHSPGLLDRMEETLQQTPWLDGERYSLADIGAVPFVKRLDEEIAPDEVTSTRHLNAAAWWASIQVRPAFAVARIEPFNTQAGQG